MSKIITEIGTEVVVSCADGDSYRGKVIKTRNGGRILFIRKLDVPEWDSNAVEIFTYRESTSNKMYYKKGSRTGDHLQI